MRTSAQTKSTSRASGSKTGGSRSSAASSARNGKSQSARKSPARNSSASSHSGNGKSTQARSGHSSSAKPKVKELDDLFEDGLKDMYWVEKALTRALPKMMAKATNPVLKSGLQMHLKETETQLARLEKVFTAIGSKPKAKPCAAMQGILEEGNEIVKETATGAVRDAGIIAACQKVEYYEITSYGTLRAFANELGYNDSVLRLLSDSLEEEKGADRKLTEIAEGGINRAADSD